MHQPISPFFGAFSLSITFLPVYLYANFTSLMGIIFLIIAYIFSYITLIAILYIIAICIHQKTTSISKPYRTILNTIIYIFLIILILFAIYLIDPPSLSLIITGALPLSILALISYIALIMLHKRPHLRFKPLIWLTITILSGIIIGIITGAIIVIPDINDYRFIIIFLLMFGVTGFIASLLSCAILLASIKVIASFLPDNIKIF